VDRFRYPPAIVERVRELAHHLVDAQIAAQLNLENQVSSKGRPYTRSMIRWIRWRHQILAPTLKTPEELTVQQVAKQFDVTDRVVYDWIDKGMIKARRFNNGLPYWITLSAADEKKLREWVYKQESNGILRGGW
jgi:excisionase family DNA binding protein